MMRGGVRPGAGRKRDPDAMVTTAFVITRQQAAWLDAHAITTGGSKSEIVRTALDALMKRLRRTQYRDGYMD